MDKEYWKDLYLLHSETKGFYKKLDTARRIAEEYASLRVKSYLSVSGGKDSVAMAHLINSTGYNYTVVSEKDDMDFPEELEFMDGFCARFGYDLKILKPHVDMWKLAEETDFTEDIHSKGTNWSDLVFYELLQKFQRENEYKGVFLGLRSEESKGRLWNRMTNGAIYYNKTWQQMVCCPLADWTAKDVFAYLFSNKLPIMDVYFQTKYVESPEQIRKSWILPSAQSSRGQALWLKYYYPDLFNRLAAINPKMRAYV